VLLGADKLEKLPPQAAPSSEIQALKAKLAKTMDEIQGKNSVLTVQDLQRLLFRCAATLISLEEVSATLPLASMNQAPAQCERDLLHYLVILPFELSTPSAISAGIEVWTWVISERLGMEVALMTEVLSAWSDTIKFEKGIFSATQKWDLCFSTI
jgi:phosphatidylinositol 4-kinase